MQLATQLAQVTDANGRTCGAMAIRLVFDREGPVLVEHNDCVNTYKGKSGTNLATGMAVRELVTAMDSRLWISLDGILIWED